MESAVENMKKITLKEFEILNTSTPAIPSSSKGRQAIIKDFEKKLKIKLIQKSNMDLEFDLIGVDPSLANALRRILISEIPTMAIEKVYIYNNTSIIQDEVFAHRLGLIPLRADPRQFEWNAQPDKPESGTAKDTLEFELKVKCKKKPDPEDESQVERSVYTKSIKWNPVGDQKSWIKGDPGPIEGDILLNKLLPGHELDIKLYAYKGIGKDHAKFSPVATTFYRLLPQITLNRTVKGEEAERLQKCFSPGVIELEGSKKKAVVKDARYDACSRNVFRHEDLKDAVTLEKVRDHFIFTIESTGAMEPEDLFLQSIDVLEQKCDYFLGELDSALSDG